MIKFLIIAVSLLFASSNAHASNVLASDIIGVVVDAQGKPMAGEVVRVVHHETNRVIERRTNSKGRYHFNNLRSDGTYTVEHNEVAYTGRVLLGKLHRQNFVGEPARYDTPAILFSWIWSGPGRTHSDVTFLTQDDRGE